MTITLYRYTLKCTVAHYPTQIDASNAMMFKWRFLLERSQQPFLHLHGVSTTNVSMSVVLRLMC